MATINQGWKRGRGRSWLSVKISPIDKVSSTMSSVSSCLPPFSLKNNVPNCLTPKYINANTQIREYNFFLQSIQKYSKYFWKGNGTRTSNTKFRFVWHANTNTQILLWSKLQICPTYAIFSERKWYEDIKNNAPSCLTCKYKYTKTQTHIYTNTQIQIWSKFQIGLTWLIFLKRYWYIQYIKNNIPKCLTFKYTNICSAGFA